MTTQSLLTSTRTCCRFENYKMATNTYRTNDRVLGKGEVLQFRRDSTKREIVCEGTAWQLATLERGIASVADREKNAFISGACARGVQDHALNKLNSCFFFIRNQKLRVNNGIVLADFVLCTPLATDAATDLMCSALKRLQESGHTALAKLVVVGTLLPLAAAKTNCTH